MSQEEKDRKFVEICKTSMSVQEAMQRLGISDVRSFKRRRKRVEERLGISLPRYDDLESLTTKVEEHDVLEMIKTIRDLRSSVAKLRNEVGDSYQYKKLIHGIVEKEPDPPKWLHKNKNKKVIHGIPTLFLSDLHWDEVVRPEQINFVNEYNREIAKDRLKRVFMTSVHLMKEVLSPSEWEGSVIPLGGDMLSGYIHDELRENKSGPLFEGVLDLLEQLVAGIDLFKREFGRVFVPCVVGNHGRLDRKPRSKFGVHDNVDWLLYQLIKRHYADDDNVTVMVPDSTDAYYRVYNVRYMLTHGNQFVGGSGIAGPATPWALGDHKKRKRQDAIKQPYDTLIFGHWHMLDWGHNNSRIVNGSLKGYDEYAFDKNYGYEPPKQALWVTHPEKGITWKVEVFADEQDQVDEMPWVSVLGD